MDDRHLSIELLRAVHRGERTPGDLAIVALTHLVDECPTCRTAFEGWRREFGEGVASEVVREYDEAFDRVKQRLHRCGGTTRCEPDGDSGLEARIEEQRATAIRISHDLVSRPRRDRHAHLRSQRKSCPAALLADALIERATEFLPGRPDEAYEAASLARAVLQSERPDSLTSELYARALAHQANALRAQGLLRQADDVLETARYLLKAQGGGERLTRAELDRFEGALRYAQRRFPEAESLYSRAVMGFAMEGEDVDVATTLLSVGVAYREMDDLDRAIEATSQALEILADEEQPHLQLYARHNMVNFLIEAERIAEAKSLFAQLEEMYAKYSDPLSSLRRTWLEGHLARAQLDLAAAETAYDAVRQGFASRGLGYDAALAALDLATLYAEQGRTAELKQVAEEIVPIFESQDVHREAAAALMLFQDAVRAEQVTLGYVLELSRYLQRARLDPRLQFQIPT